MIRCAGVLILTVLLGVAGAGQATDDAEAILKASAVRGGLCLIVDAADLSMPEALANAGSLYVRVLQPDAAKAGTWGGKVAHGELREKIGVAAGPFNPRHYGSDLFNLVIVNNWPAVSDAIPLAELKRMLVPGGVAALANPPAALVERAVKQGFERIAGPKGRLLLQRPAGPIGEFAPCDAVRWRSGSRYQRIMSHDFQSVVFGDGKLLYRETVSRIGGGLCFELVCRDACNGRTLWTIEEPAFTNAVWRGYLRSRMGAAIASNGKVYTGLGKDFVCLDAETGKVLAILAKGARPGQVIIHNDKYLLAGGKIRDLKTAKVLGKYTGGRIVVSGDVVCGTRDGKIVVACRIPDGKVLWRVDTQKDQPGGHPYRLFCSDTALHISRGWPAASLSTMDLKTGKTLWVYPPPPRPKVRDVPTYVFGDKLYIAYRDKTIKEKHDFALMAVEAATGKVLRKKIYAPGKKWAGGCWRPRRAGDYVLYHHNLWLNTKTLERTYLVLFRPKCDQGPLPRNGMIYGFPGRKAGAIKGIAALAPRDIEFDSVPGGKVLKTHAPAPDPTPAAAKTDWPMFRGNAVRGNAVNTSLGKTLTLKWTATVGLGKRTYGAMDSERTGLSQAVCRDGLAAVADIEGQRVVAFNTDTGDVKWTFHVGARVDFPPTFHRGLALVAAKDGWAYCLDAKTGKLIYRLLIAPHERYIGGQETLESMWPTAGDVAVFNGIAYASAGLATNIHGGIRVVAFLPRSGRVVWSRCISGKPTINDLETQPTLLVHNPGSGRVRMGHIAFDPKTGKSGRANRGDHGLLRSGRHGSMEDWLSTNNRLRLCEDMGGVVVDNGRGGVSGRLIAFSASFGIGSNVARKGKTIYALGPITVSGKSRDGKTKWSSPSSELNVDDLVLTPDAAYCVGHYETGAKPAELRILSVADGSVLATHPIDAFPAYNGMSAAGSKLFIATRDGKLICFEGRGGD